VRTELSLAVTRALPMTDWFLHHVLDFLPALGVTTIYATYSRWVADLNRPASLDRTDPKRVNEGFVPLHTQAGDAIYNDPPPEGEIALRRDLVYAPYHARLLELLQSRITRFGGVVLVDMHSSPTHMPGRADLGGDVYLGDLNKSANSGWLTQRARQSLEHAGLSVMVNNHIKGGYTVEHYSAISRVAALHVELRAGLYLDEEHPDRTPSGPRLDAFKAILRDTFTDLVAEIRRQRRVDK
jgi:N-formylglutamate deformylase